MNNFQKNNAPAAHGPTVSEMLGGIYPKATVAAINAITKDVERIQKERSKYLRPVAEQAIRDRRDRAHADPSDKNLAALSAETPEELTARFENVANELHGVIDTSKQALHPHYLVVLSTLTAALTVQMGKLEAVNRRQHETYGISYSPETDAMLLSLARFLDNASIKLDCERCVCWPDELKSFLGELRPGGLFS